MQGAFSINYMTHGAVNTAIWHENLGSHYVCGTFAQPATVINTWHILMYWHVPTKCLWFKMVQGCNGSHKERLNHKSTPVQCTIWWLRALDLFWIHTVPLPHISPRWISSSLFYNPWKDFRRALWTSCSVGPKDSMEKESKAAGWQDGLNLIVSHWICHHDFVFISKYRHFTFFGLMPKAI